MSNENEIEELLGDTTPTTEDPVSEDTTTIEPPSPAVLPDEEVPPEGSEPPPPDPEPQAGTPVVEPPVSTSTASEADPRDAQITQMQETIAALQATIESVSKQVGQPKVEEPGSDTSSVQVHKFVEKEDDLDKALNTVDNFNELLSNVSAKIEEIVLAKVDALASRVAHAVYTQRSTAGEFYTQNPDLASNKAYVALVANELAAANPEWGMDKIVSNLATEVRSRLKMGMPAPAIEDPAPQGNNGSPAFAGSNGGGRRTGLPKPADPVEREVADLMEGF